ncbi:hypothetical protein [Anatilimnocola floriformis]|uniref:hypothetical protein n=1 Tax=Anatilimnocola floriformis TaxID=2948575 RepID=UPI0020C2EC5B|nr:hypothetical protein [Anatilimnocola floriformis]
MSKSGFDIFAQFVSTVLSNAKKKGGKVGKRGRKPMAVPVDGLQQLIQVKKLVDQIGGLEKAKAAVDALAQILG